MLQLIWKQCWVDTSVVIFCKVHNMEFEISKSKCKSVVHNFISGLYNLK